MRIDSKSGVRGMLFNAQTGQPIRWAVWAEIPEKAPGVPDETREGEYEANRIDPRDAERLGLPLSAIRYRGRCRLRFVEDSLAREFSAAPAPASVPSPRRGGIFIPPGTGEEECEVHGCHRRAVWYTHDTEAVEPLAVDGKLFGRRRPTLRHYFCDRCYRQPTTTSLRGVESEVEVRMGRPE